MSTPFNVVCVLRSGGDYKIEHVHRLQQMVHQNCKVAHKFICLSDQSIPGVTTVPMQRDWPGWWSKLELFEHFDQAFYLDLDTTLVGDISALVSYRHVFTMLRDLGKPTIPASGLMAWTGNYSGIAKTFAKNPAAYMNHCNVPNRWGDQGFIAQHINPEFFQDIFADAVASYKYEVKAFGLNPKTKVVCFHGKPRPWDVEEL